MANIKVPSRRGTRPVWPNKTVMNPGKGLNNLISETLIADEEASDLLNIQFVESGCVSKRNGHTEVGTGLSNAPKGLGSYVVSSSAKYLLTIDGTGLKYLNGTTWTAISGASFTSGLNTTFVQCKGEMYIWNGTEAGAKLTSSLTLTRPTTTVSAKFGIFYGGRQIVAGVATQPNRLYISNATAMDDFTVTTGGTAPQPDNSTEAPGATVFSGTPAYAEANVIDINKDDGDKITGLAKYQDVLIIFKERSVWQLTFDAAASSVDVQQINGAVGAVSHRAIDNMENDVIFLSRNGYYVLGSEPNYFNAIRTNELSSRINPVIQTISAANFEKVSSLFSGYVFRSSIPSGGTTTNNKTITYDRRYQSWSVLNEENANAYSEFIDTSNVKHLYYAADDEAKVYEINTGYSDNGTAIDAYFVTKAFDMDDFSQYKQFIDVDLLFRQLSGTVTVTFITDGEEIVKTSTVSSTNNTDYTWGASDGWGEYEWGGEATTAMATSTGSTTQNVPYRFKLNKIARSLKIKVSNANDNENFVLLGIKIYYRPYKHAKFPGSLKVT